MTNLEPTASVGRRDHGLALADALLESNRRLPPLPVAAHDRVKRRLRARLGNPVFRRVRWLRPLVIAGSLLLWGTAFGIAIDRFVIEHHFPPKLQPQLTNTPDKPRARRPKARPESPITVENDQAASSEPAVLPSVATLTIEPALPTPAKPASMLPMLLASARPRTSRALARSSVAFLDPAAISPPARTVPADRIGVKRPQVDHPLPPGEGRGEGIASHVESCCGRGDSISVTSVSGSAEASPSPPSPSPGGRGVTDRRLGASNHEGPSSPAVHPLDAYAADRETLPVAGSIAPAALPAPLPEVPVPTAIALTTPPAPHRPPEKAAAEDLSEERLLAAAVRALRAKQDAASALLALDAYRTRYPQGRLFVEASVLRVDALTALHRQPEALRALDALDLSRMPGGLERRLQRGEMRAASGRLQEAVADFDGVLSRAREQDLLERALGGRAQARQRLGDRAGARSDAIEYLRRFPAGTFARQARDLSQP